MRFVLLAAILAACSSSGGANGDGGPSADVPVGIGPDARPGSIDAPGAAPADAPTLGRLCVTTATDGGPGSCSGGEICCATVAPYLCTLTSDCPGGGGYKACSHSPECQGGVCCQLPGMIFCTKAQVCAAYGGTVLP
ncbi:MAG TPA: hypothetical protein VKE22_02925 [Haliangiales bacterium]|nr:hypothetical protein [Haliangiales bacterium]